MTSTGQGLGANPLLGGVELPSVSNAKGLTKAIPGSLSENSNVLKNNDFSNVLKRHWAVDDGRRDGVATPSGSLIGADAAVYASGSFSFRDMEFSGKFTAGIAAEGGNALPASAAEGLAAAEGNAATINTNPEMESQFFATDGADSGRQGESGFKILNSGQQTASGHIHAADGLLTSEGVSGERAVASAAGLVTHSTAAEGVETQNLETRGLGALGSEIRNSESGAGDVSGTTGISGDSPISNGYASSGSNGYAGSGAANNMGNTNSNNNQSNHSNNSKPGEVLNAQQANGRQLTGEFTGQQTGQASFTAASTLQLEGQGLQTRENASLAPGAVSNSLFASQLQSLKGKSLLQGAAEGKGLSLAAKLGAEQLATATSQALSSQSGDSAAMPGSAAAISHSYTTSEPATLQTAVPVPVGKPGWNETVMQRVMWMSSQQINKAEIALDPPELGPLHVKISSQGEHTSVVFSSAHGAVRDALDQGLPRLREMLENQGLNLADVDVSDHSASQQQAHSDGFNGEAEEGQAGAGGTSEEAEPHSVSNQSTVASTLSLVDQYV